MCLILVHNCDSIKEKTRRQWWAFVCGMTLTGFDVSTLWSTADTAIQHASARPGAGSGMHQARPGQCPTS